MIIYQYRGPLTDETKLQYFADLIKNGAMKFSEPSEFNDPFDCCPTRFSKPYESNTPHAIADEINKFNQSVTSKLLGISCFTTHPNKLLMWSHYGDQHKSVCVGFDSDILLNEAPKNSEGNPLYTEITKVKYTNSRPAAEDKEAILKKSEEWSYEDEHRIISLSQKGNPQWGAGVWNIPVTAIKEVVIGARVDRGLQDRIVDIIQQANHEIEIKKAILHTHSFELVIEQLSNQPKTFPTSGYVLGPNGNWIECGDPN